MFTGGWNASPTHPSPWWVLSPGGAPLPPLSETRGTSSGGYDFSGGATPPFSFLRQRCTEVWILIYLCMSFTNFQYFLYSSIYSDDFFDIKLIG